MGSAAKLPRDTTNPLFYAPIALVATGIVAFVFVSGFGTAQFDARVADKYVPPAKEGAKKAVNVQSLAVATAEQVALGKTLYEVNCSSCHGKTGYGDGEKGANLNPPPRNFHQSGGWKNGYSVPGMWKTLENGIPGGSMAAYRLLPAEERMAMIHYIRASFLKDISVPPPTSEEIAQLPGGGAGAAATAEVPEAPKPKIAVRDAIAQLAAVDTSKVDVHATLPEALASLPGAALYSANCASCHGSAGQGVAGGRTLGTYPIVRVTTGSLVGAEGAWVDDQKAFRELLVEPMPGFNSHDFATLSGSDIKALHEFLTRLSATAHHASAGAGAGSAHEH